MKKPFRNEYDGAELGDSRRGARLVALGKSLATFPGRSFPEALRDGAQLEAAYRFFSNPQVEALSVLGPHQRETAKRCEEHDTVVVAHDTTEFAFTGEGREGLGYLRGKKRGFLSHVALAVTLDECREPLGVLNFESWTRQGDPAKKATKPSPRQRQRMAERESTRWLRGVMATAPQLQAASALHVMDREADDYELFAGLATENQRFVIRSTFDRRLADGEKLLDRVHDAHDVVVTREVAISKRQRSPLPAQRRIHPPRNGRIAKLGLKAIPVTVLRPRDLPSELPPSLSMNVVIVEEINAPKDEPAVEWRLYTTEPIQTAQQLEAVVDAYRCRWRIEEFFKALKTGCAIQKRQLESAHALMNAVAIFIPIAWRILRHRTLAHTDGTRPATRILTPLQICILRKKALRPLPLRLTIADALTAVAVLGGHLKRNGPPGWITIARGYQSLLALEEGARLAMEM